VLSRGWSSLPPSPGYAPADTARGAVSLHHRLGLTQLCPRTPGPSLQSPTLQGVSLSQAQGTAFVLLEFSEVPVNLLL